MDSIFDFWRFIGLNWISYEFYICQWAYIIDAVHILFAPVLFGSCQVPIKVWWSSRLEDYIFRPISFSSNNRLFTFTQLTERFSGAVCCANRPACNICCRTNVTRQWQTVCAMLKACPHWRLVADFGHNLSPKTATVAEKCEFGDCRRFLAVFGDSRRFLRQSSFSVTVWTRLKTFKLIPARTNRFWNCFLPYFLTISLGPVLYWLIILYQFCQSSHWKKIICLAILPIVLATFPVDNPWSW